MAIRILTKNNVQNTNIDGARDCHFNSANKSGIVKGAFSEGRVFSPAQGQIAIEPCELRVFGHRIVIDSNEVLNLPSTPASDTIYSFIAQISVSSSVPTFSLFVQTEDTPLVQENLYANSGGNGIYQVELAVFTYTSAGNVEDIERKVIEITGESYTHVYAERAERASESARGYATNASNSANTASGYANDASRYATNASNSATEAQGYADAIPTFELVGTTLYITTRNSQ